MSEIEPVWSKELVAWAAERGVLSPKSEDALQRDSVVSQIESALEDSYTLESGNEVLLVTLMPDDSQSMTISRKNEGVIEGHNDLLKAFRQSPAADKILLQTRYLNGHVLNPFQPIELCKDLTEQNYRCVYGTPLFEQTIVTLGVVIAKTEELLQQGATSVRSATLVMTDAESTDILETLQEEVASVIGDIRRIGDHLVAGMGFSASAGDEAFRRAFIAMGIDPGLVFTARNRSEILQAFKIFTARALELTSRDDDRENP